MEEQTPEGVGPRRVGGQKFRAFCHLSRHNVPSFLLSLGGSFVEFWWCWKRQKCARVEFSGFKSQKFHEETPEREKEREWERESEKKTRIVGLPRCGPLHAAGPHWPQPLGPQLFPGLCPHSSAPSPFEPPHLRATLRAEALWAPTFLGLGPAFLIFITFSFFCFCFFFLFLIVVIFCFPPTHLGRTRAGTFRLAAPFKIS